MARARTLAGSSFTATSTAGALSARSGYTTNARTGEEAVLTFTHSRCRVVMSSSSRAVVAEGSTDRVARACSRAADEPLLDKTNASSVNLDTCLNISPSQFKYRRRN
jgi:hypothetical protein